MYVNSCPGRYNLGSDFSVFQTCKYPKLCFHAVKSILTLNRPGFVHVPNFGGLSGSEDRGGGDNGIQFINFGRVGDKIFK